MCLFDISFIMEFKPLYPEDDKAKLTIDKTEDWLVKFDFEILERYRNSLWLTFWPTIWYGNSWDFRTPVKVKKHLSNIVDYATDGIIHKDDKWKLIITRSSWSSDITIAYRLNNPEKLKDRYEIILDKNYINKNVLNELLLLFTD